MAVIAALIIIISGNRAREHQKQETIAQALSEAQSYVKKEDYASALDVLVQVDEAYPDNQDIIESIETYYVDGVILDTDKYLSAEQYEQAGTLITEALEKYPENLILLDKQKEVYLSHVQDQADRYIRTGDYDSAAATIEEALATYPDEESLLQSQINIQVMGSLVKAGTYLDEGDEESAQEILNALLEAYPEDESIQKQCESLVFTRKLSALSALIQSASFEEAETFLAELEISYPDSSEVGQLRSELDAAVALQQRIAQEKEDREVSLAIEEAQGLLAENDYEGAEETIIDLQKEYPDNTQLQEMLSNIYYQQLLKNIDSAIEQEQYEDAEALLESLETDYPDSLDLVSLQELLSVQRASAEIRKYLREGNLEEAQVLLSEEQEQYPENAQLKALQEEVDVAKIIADADVMIQAEDYDAAEELLKTAQETYPDNEDLSMEREVLSLCREPQYLMKQIAPWITDGYDGYVNGIWFTINDQEYTNGFILKNSYADAWFNLQGKYTSMEFDLVGEAGAQLRINLEDSKIPEQTIQVKEGEEQHITVPLDGMDYIRFSQKEEDWYVHTAGLANIVLYSDFATAKAAVFQSKLDEDQRYLFDLYESSIFEKRGCTVYANGETFTMCGVDYTNGFTLRSEYKDAVVIELEDAYSLLEFDVGWIPQFYSFGSSEVKVYLDEATIPALQLKISDTFYVRHCSIPLDGVKTIYLSGGDDWNNCVGVGNIVLTK